MRRRIFSTRQA